MRCIVRNSTGGYAVSKEVAFTAGAADAAPQQQCVAIMTAKVNVRPEPSAKKKAIGQLQKGNEITLLGYVAPKGYTATASTKSPGATRRATPTSRRINVGAVFCKPYAADILGKVYIQSRMSTSSKYRLATLCKGDSAQLIGRYKTWWIVQHGGEAAYIKNGKCVQP